MWDTYKEDTDCHYLESAREMQREMQSGNYQKGIIARGHIGGGGMSRTFHSARINR